MPKDNPPELDRQIVHHAMKKCGGNVAQAFDMLVESGMTEATNRKWLDRLLRKDPALKAVWIDQTSSYSLIEMPSQLSPEDELAINEEMMRREQEFIDAANMDDLFGEDAEEALSFARFSEESFSKSINIVHTLAVKDAFALHKRAEWIVDNVLLNEDMEDKVEITESGDKVEYRAPKYSENDKKEWQREHTTIMSEIRKFSEAANNAALARIKAKEIAMKIGNGDGKGDNGKSRRGNRKFKG